MKDFARCAGARSVGQKGRARGDNDDADEGDKRRGVDEESVRRSATSTKSIRSPPFATRVCVDQT